MAIPAKSNLSFVTGRITSSVLVLLLLSSFYLVNVSNHGRTIAKQTNPATEAKAVVEVAHTTVRLDVVFAGYNETLIDTALIQSGLTTSVFYPGVDFEWNENSEQYESILDLQIDLDFSFHFASENYTANLDSFIETNSWNATTSALNRTQLNLQEETGERMSIFYEQEGRAIDGEALEQYLVDNNAFTPAEPSYVIYFLNQSRYDTSDHSFEHWFEIDEVDPDSNVTTDWWRLEWDNDLNPDVEFPYPCWGFQNRVFFVDPYCHQWYTKWTDVWWNPDELENDFDYLNVDLDTYLEGYTPNDPSFKSELNEYLTAYLEDISTDVGGRGDGRLTNERDVSAQILLINDETHHGYNKENLEWIYHSETAKEAFEYVVPNNVANITLEETWVELSNCSDLEQIVNDNILGATELSTYPWYKPDWTYLDGIGIFYAFENIAHNYFDLEKGDATFTSWVLLLQNISMVGYAYGEYREFTGLGGGGNVVCFKDLNRYYATDGTTPRSGLSTLLIHEIGHVLGFLHAEITNDAEQGTGGFIRDVMSYYSEGTPYFSIFLKDSLYRSSSYMNYFRNKPAIDDYRANSRHNETILATIDAVIDQAEAALDEMEYIEAFLKFRQLYKLTENLPLISTSQTTTANTGLPAVILLIPIGFLVATIQKRKRRF